MKSYHSIVDLFDTIFYEFEPFLTQSSVPQKIYDFSFPPMNMWVNEDSKDLEYDFAIAGIPKEKVSVSFEGDHMYLTIENSSQKREGWKIVQQGIKQSEWKQKIYVPSSKYDTQNAKARFIDGVLTITIPAREETKPKQLLIE